MVMIDLGTTQKSLGRDHFGAIFSKEKKVCIHYI